MATMSIWPSTEVLGTRLDMAPPELKPQLTAEIDEVAEFRIESYLLHTFEIVILLLFFLKIFFDLRYFVAVRICPFDDVELPLGRIKMRSAEDAPVECLARSVEIFSEPLAEVVTEWRYQRFELLIDPFV